MLYFYKVKTVEYHRENPNNQMTTLGDSGNKKLPFYRKKSPAEPCSRRGSHLPQGVRGMRQDKRHTVEER